MSRGLIKRLLIIIVLTIGINSVSNIFGLEDLYTLIIIVVSTLLLMVIFDYKKFSLEVNIKRNRANIFLVSMFLTFSELLSSLNYTLGQVEMGNIVNSFKPLVLGVYTYLVFINVAESFIGIELSETDAIKILTKQEPLENFEEVKKQKALELIKNLGLTRREKEIFDLLLVDMPNKEISEKLYIAEATVKKHVQNILKKADCGNRVEVIEKYSK